MRVVDIELPSEASSGWSTGRPGPAHTSAVRGSPTLVDALQTAFPGC
jgi:hypothetical protein